MVFIAHDLAVVKNVSDRVAVMYLGKLCEVAPPDTLYRRPEHPYTEALLTSIPEPDPTTATNGKAPLAGDLPSPIDPPSGCRFRTRCPIAQQKCADEEPQMRAMGPDHFVACHFPLGGSPVNAFATPAPQQAPVSAQGQASWSVQAPDPSPSGTPPPPPPPPPPAPPPPARPAERPPLWIDPPR
jgi:oligopeptide/dipeptide ABC transporter ATP-binding protein